jgi:hypothetical protein
MADSTLAAMDALDPVVDASSSYIEAVGVQKKVAASVWKTYVSDTPTLVTPNLGTPSAGDISACTSTSIALVTPVLGTVTSGDISACTSTSLTMVTPVLGTVTSGDISACTSTSMALTTPAIGTVASGDVSACTSTSQTFVTPVLGTVTSGDISACTGNPVLTLMTRSVAAAVTALAGGAQGGAGALTKDVNNVTTCATAADSVTLPTAVAGMEITVVNNGAEACNVFPASGADLGAGADTAASLAINGANITYVAISSTLWFAKT